MLIAHATLSKMKLPPLLKAASHGGHLKDPNIEVVTAKSVTLDADRPLPLCFDGDQFGEVPATVTLRPAGLRLLTV